MAFSKAKIQRFNEVLGCGPPPGTYEPKWADKPILGIFDKSRRFNQAKNIDASITVNFHQPATTPVAQKKTSQMSSVRRQKANQNASFSAISPPTHGKSSKDRNPRQEEILERKVMQPSEGCGCNLIVQEATIKYAAKIKEIMECHQCELERLSLLENRMEENANLMMNLKMDILQYKEKIISLTNANSNMTDITSSQQQLIIEHRLRNAKLQDTIYFITTQRDEIAMEYKKMKSKLKDTTLETDKISLKASEAEALAVSESDAKRAMENVVSKISQDLRESELKVRSLEEKLSNVDNDLALEKSQSKELKSRFEKALSEAKEVILDKFSQEKREIKELYSQKVVAAESECNEKASELNRTRKEYSEVTKLYELETKCKRQKEDELAYATESLKHALQKIEDLIMLNEKSENIKLASMKSINQELPTAAYEDEKGLSPLDKCVHCLKSVVKTKSEMSSSNHNLESEIKKKDSQIHDLEQLIGPFREQLEMYEQERQALTNITVQTKGQLEQLALQHAAALGHQNHKQKIRHLVQLKEHNLKLQEEIQELNNKLRHKDRIIKKINKLDKGDEKILFKSGKENSISK